jgi:hypothetical protein
MKSKLEKKKGKIILLEIGEERNRKKLEEDEDMIMEIQEIIKHLELYQKSGIEELRKSIVQVALIVFFGQDPVTTMEDDIVEQKIEQSNNTNPYLLSSVVGRKRLSHMGPSNQNV